MRSARAPAVYPANVSPYYYCQATAHLSPTLIKTALQKRLRDDKMWILELPRNTESFNDIRTVRTSIVAPNGTEVRKQATTHGSAAMILWLLSHYCTIIARALPSSRIPARAVLVFVIVQAMAALCGWNVCPWCWRGLTDTLLSVYLTNWSFCATNTWTTKTLSAQSFHYLQTTQPIR